MNFIKLKDQFFFTQEDIQEQDELMTIGDGVLRNFNIDTANPKIQKIYNLIPAYAHRFFSISGITISDNLIPHTDDVRTSIIFYINTSGYKTQFYKINTDKPVVQYSSTELNGQAITDPKSYRPETYRTEDLTEDGYYIANNTDAYCLDGSKPHALIPLDKQAVPQVRSFILFKTPIPFAGVVSLLKKTNSI